MLELAGLFQSYGESRTLWDAELSLEQGRCLCLMGRNGVGKTTLLKAIMGLLKVEQGSIRFKGKELSGRRPELRAQLGIGYVPQGREIFPQLTVRENLEVGLLGRSDRTVDPMAKIYDLFPVLKDMLHRRIFLAGSNNNWRSAAR